MQIRYVNLFQNGECYIEGKPLKFGEITPYINASGLNEISAEVLTSHGRMLIKKKLPAEKVNISVAIIKSMQKPALVIIEEPFLQKREDRAYVRFVNLSEKELKVLRVNGDIVCNLLPDNQGKYLLAQEGGYVFELSSEKRKKVITCRLEKENKYSLYIIENQNKNGYDFFVYKDE